MILDPFAGCATALVAGDRLQRQWVGIDLSPLAAKLVLKRLREDRGALFDDVLSRKDIPARTDHGRCRATRRTGTRSMAARRAYARGAASCFHSAT